MKCKEKTEIYSRIVGFYRPTKLWNKGKQEEKKERKDFKIESNQAKSKINLKEFV